MNTPRTVPSQGQLLRSPMHHAGKVKLARRFSWLIWFLIPLGAIALVFAPWTQSIQGSGRVIAFAPLERRQLVEAPIGGRVKSWFVQEGDYVKKGDRIAEISDNDPAYVSRLRTERDAVHAQIKAQELSIDLTSSRIESQKLTRDFGVDNVTQKLTVLDEKIQAKRRRLESASAVAKTAEQNLARQSKLLAQGLASQRKHELAQLSVDTTKADLARARSELRGAKAERKALLAERAKVKAAYEASIDSTRSSLEKLRAEKSKSQAELAKVEVRLARQAQLVILAPRDGTVLRFLAKEGAETVKAGDPLIEFVPSTQSRAVEIWVDGNDAPLMQAGRQARIQFEGWPAVQFMGWPSVAIGSFPAQVDFVDAHADERGYFRVVLTPVDTTWPDGHYLRQGVRARAWVLVNRVSLGYEAWRQMNGFPATSAPAKGKGASKAKKKE